MVVVVVVVVVVVIIIVEWTLNPQTLSNVHNVSVIDVSLLCSSDDNALEIVLLCKLIY